MQAYSDPKRESDPHALPDLEIFYWTSKEASDYWGEDADEELEAGFYFWYCFPGCMPDSEPNGPYATQQEALEAAREDNLEDE